MKKNTLSFEHIRSRRLAAGYLLIETALALAIGSITMFYQIKQKQSELIDTVAISQGESLKKVGDAVNAYSVTNYSQILNNTAVTGVVNARQPTVAELSNLGFLPTGFKNTTFSGGGYQIALTLSPAACVLPNCQVSGYVVTTTPFTVGGAQSTQAVGQAIITAGADAGASMTNGAVIEWSNGSGTMANPVAGQPKGIIAMRVGAASIEFQQFLRRDGSLSMSGPLNMGNQAINNAGNITSSGTIAGNTVTAAGNMSAGGTITAGGNITSGGTVSGSSVTATNNVSAGGVMNANGGFQVGGTQVIDSSRNLVNINAIYASSGVYTNDWFRNQNAGQGVYNQTTGNHLYSEGTYWTMSSAGASAGGLFFRQGYGGSPQGYVYYDASGFGLLSSDGNWRMRTQPGMQELYGSTYENATFSNIYYDRNNTNYYMQPSQTSMFNSLQSNIYYDRNNTNYYMQPSAISMFNDVRANIYYDRNNTGYYVQPSATNRLNYVVADNMYTYGWMQADTYYDRYNNGYYLQLRGTNRMANVYADYLRSYGNAQVDGNLYTGGHLIRNGAGTGYLDGNYGTSETASTSGAIYTIGGGYQPTATTLGNMYGIGFGYSGYAGIGATGAPGSHWGMYAASGGVSRIFLDSDTGNGYFNGNLYSAGNLVLNTSNSPYAANMNQYVRTTDAPTFAGVTANGYYRGAVQRGSYGSISIAGTTNSYSGIDFSDQAITLMVNPGATGFLKNNNAWIWYVDGGGNMNTYAANPTLNGGTILTSSNDSYAWNMNQYVRTTDAPTFAGLTSNGTTYLNSTTHQANGTSFIQDGYNNNGYYAMNNNGTYYGLMGNVSPNDWRLGYGSATTLANWNIRWDNIGNAWVNQALGVGGSISATGPVTGSDIYSNGWLRNNSNNTGLYNQVQGRHFYMTARDRWVSASGSGMEFLDSYEGNLKGYVYFNASGFGLLSSDGSWRMRTQPGYQELYGTTYEDSTQSNIYYDRNNTNYYMQPSNVSMFNDLRANIYYDRNNTGYYMQPSSTSRMNYVVTDNSYSYGWMQANVFYDSGDNGYYLQPRGTNRMNYVDADSINSRGTITASGNITTPGAVVAGYFLPSTVATVGTGCWINGTMAQDSGGAILSCQSGLWTAGGKVAGASLLFTVNGTWWMPPAASYCNGCGNWQINSFYTDASGSVFLNQGAANNCCSLQTINLTSVLICTRNQMNNGTCAGHVIYTGTFGSLTVTSLSLSGNTLTFSAWGVDVWAKGATISWTGTGA